MRCSMNSLKKPIDQPFAAGAGIQLPRSPPADPYQALDDLMAAVEILCPTWPKRGTFKDKGDMLL
jgi:hypothetical protein